MATFGEMRVALQAMSYVDGFRRTLRFEAQSYIDTLTAGTVIVNGVPTPALGVVQDIITHNRVGFATTVSRYQTFMADAGNRTTLTNGLAGLNVPLTEANNLVTLLGQAVTTHATADISTDPLIRTMAASMLATVPTLPGIVPEV